MIALLLLLGAVCTHAQVPNVPHGGGPCQTDYDCSLGGLCTISKCVCDIWFTGPACDLLNLAPAPSQDYGLQVAGYYSWGGHALRSPDDGLYHGFFSFMCKHAMLDEWTTKSSIWRATSRDSRGPFALQEMVAQPWSHNAMIAFHPPSQEFHLWQIGNAVTPSSQWSPCYQNGSMDMLDTEPSNTSANQIYVRSSKSLLGPWTSLNNNTGVVIDFGTTWANANGANGGNPSVVYFPNGTTLLYFAAKPCPPNWPHALAPKCVGMARADAWNGPYTVTSMTPIISPESEDPFVFQDPRGNFHMLTNVNTYHLRCAQGVECGGHAWSYDGLTWSNQTLNAFGPAIRFTNGSYWLNAYAERPQILQDVDGTPLTFYLGLGRTSYLDSASWAQSFCRVGVANCGPTWRPT